VHLTHLFNNFFRLSNLLAPRKEAKIITLPKHGKDPTFPQNLRSIRILSIAGKLFEKLILRTTQKHSEERNLLNVTQFRFPADHSNA
jgi:hypothetical protein